MKASKKNVAAEKIELRTSQVYLLHELKNEEKIAGKSPKRGEPRGRYLLRQVRNGGALRAEKS